MYLMAFVALDCIGSMIVFFVRDYLGRAGDVGLVSGLVLASQAIAMPAYLWVMRRYGKALGYLSGACLWIAGMLGSFLLAPEQPAWILYLFAALIGLGVGGVSLSVYAMFPDIPDVDELQSGERREGMYSSFFTLARKFSSALALFVVAQVIEVAGYTPPDQIVVGGLTRLAPAAQSETFLLTLRLLFALLPVVMLAIGVTVARRYPLSRELHAELATTLETRRINGGRASHPGQDVLAQELIGPG
jgi:Na+/melibiose symporter-like transporter